MKNILVTGAAGNIGSALVVALLKRGCYSVTAIDNLSTGNRHKLPDSHENLIFIKADVNTYQDIAPIFQNRRFDYVFHFAAVVGVKRTIENPISVLEDIDGIKNILMLSKNCGIERVYFSSSSEVYGEPVSIPQNELISPLNARLPYAVVKNIGEVYCKAYQQEHGLSFTIFRFFNTYGPNQSDDFVVPRFLKAALANEPIYIYGDGSQTRTFCYIDDNIDTIVRVFERKLFINDTLNIGSDVPLSIISLAKLIVNKVQSSSEIIFLPPLPEGDMTRRLPDIARMKSVLNRDLIPIDKGVAQLVSGNIIME